MDAEQALQKACRRRLGHLVSSPDIVLEVLLATGAGTWAFPCIWADFCVGGMLWPYHLGRWEGQLRPYRWKLRSCWRIRLFFLRQSDRSRREALDQSMLMTHVLARFG